MPKILGLFLKKTKRRKKTKKKTNTIKNKSKSLKKC